MANRAWWRSWAVLGALALLPRCACDSPPADALERCSTSEVFAGKVKTDILFVIDDSGSMDEEQANLSANLGRFIDRLAALPIQDDYQIGVTTTDVEDFAGPPTFDGGPEAGHPYPRGALVAVSQNTGGQGIPGDLIWDAVNGFGGSRILTKGSPTLIRDFKANVLVGTSGSGKEQAFRAIQLAIVVVTDEDDCSDSSAGLTTNDACHLLANKQTRLDSVAEFAAFLQGAIGGEVRDTVVAAIAGVAPGSLDLACVPATCCTSAFDRSDRLVALAQAMGPRGRLASICDPSFGTALEDFATAIMSQTMPLDGTPADWRMLVATVTKPGGAALPCRIVPLEASVADRSAADAIYAGPQAGRPASLTFQGNCALSPGDLVDVKVVCAG
jgi:hypothetical protein